ncbi:DUF3021 domain-containing protein [Liquorilactobacillus mali]|uniref:Integral membrane protein n=1 Tax=Liquorilactobacillus mali KCTC 3596 = DSM 20444 TaxID=1046596 RepID=J0URT3_9LACO|nr:DUF3021 domain-containing protein [Liquorilactobacillus mali]EJE99325.1 hypothetical protein LMA_05946 [Liquorilactobacillus mali KCTC 3596 = DSM 20444]KRN10421.1 hypothetical protein FD00_GL000187 [Liquorilactobacillus mali KCTC 3596 = DSM 20444]MDC7952662.1 DUF3021 domain-containing protein [Liquorilactobacillus mali]MDV7758103.1 DUF3021 family protein [Liquorilactobacillus mali]QFQ74646.1 DUF3021 domain-containing protein [Liquorilactobacillus mali]
MLKFFRDLTTSFSIGVGFGATIYLLFIAFEIEPNATTLSILSVLVISGLIGVLSLIFEVTEWPYLIELFIHFLGTFCLVVLMAWINNWPIWQGFISFFLSFVGIYLVIWFILKLEISENVNRVNQKLQERNGERK